MENNNTDKAMAQEFTVSMSEFLDMVKVVTPAVCKDKTLPILCSVHVVERGGRLAFEGTDRYSLVRAYSRGSSAVSDGLSVAIPFDEIKRTVKLCREVPTKDRAGLVVKYSLVGEVLTGPSGVVEGYCPDSFPRVQRLLDLFWDSCRDVNMSDGLLVNAKQLGAVLSGVSVYGDRQCSYPVRVYANDRQIGFTVGRDVEGIVMRVHAVERENDFGLGAKATKAKATKATRKVAKAKVVKAKPTKEATVTKAKVTKAKATKAKVTKAKATKPVKKLQGRTAKESATLLRKALYREYRNNTRFMVKREGERRSVARVVWAGGPAVSEVEAFVKPFTAGGSGLTGAVFERTDATV